MSLGLFQLLGVVGFVCYIAAFGAVQLGALDGNGVLYTLLNVVAALLVGASLYAEFNLSAALIQGSWIVIGLVGLLRRLSRMRVASKQMLLGTASQEGAPCQS